VLTTFKWNVHTQGRSAYWKYNSEIVHTNPAFMHPDTGAALGLREGDRVRLSVKRPKGHTYRAGESGVMGTIDNHVRFLRGMHPKVIACSHHMGHWEHGVVARADSKFNANKGEFSNEGELPADRDLPGSVWWSRDNGGPGGGVHLNDALPINPAPLVGGQNWFDNVCTVEKIRT